VLKKEYVQTAIMIVLIIIIVVGIWAGSQAVLGTQYPALAVVSTSMLPTLNVGDLLIIQGTNPADINANYTTGDIVVFRSPSNPDYRIVHRAVRRELTADGYVFTTHGDNNPTGAEEKFQASYLIGRVIARVPYVGNISLFMNAQGNIYYIILAIILILIISTFYDTVRGKESENEPHERRKLFGKLDTEMIFVIVLNVLLISFAALNLWGAFTFWQPGAEPPQYVTVRGMYPDLQFHESFKKLYNNVNEAFVSHGFLTYKIDSMVDNSIRPGVPTLSWAQVAIIMLIIFDVWKLAGFLRSRKTLNAKTDA
jgi:signal peptidase I